MPELPEVETLRRGLEKAVTGRRLVQVEVTQPKILKGQSEAEFRDGVVGRRLASVQRRGKYILILLQADDSPSSPVALCLHLKMRGSVRLQHKDTAIAPHHCASFFLDNEHVLRFHDPWVWGELRLIDPSDALPLGEEPLDPDWNAPILGQHLAGRKKPIKVALLDQMIVAGVGNIYADEALFRAKIAPQRVAGTLTASELECLATAIQTVLTEAIAAGGSVGDYVDLWGNPGRYVPLVYDRDNEPCPRCGNKLSKVRLGGRGTTFCPRCQN